MVAAGNAGLSTSFLLKDLPKGQYYWAIQTIDSSFVGSTFTRTATFEAPRTLSIDDVALDEGASGSRTATFTVTLSAASSQTVTVAYATANGTASAGSDYTAASGTLSFAPGETAKTVSIAVAGDSVIEPSETFTVGLSGVTNAMIARATGTGTIRNDDFPALSINDVSLAEGNSGTTNAVLTATLSAAAPFAVTVDYATANGTADGGQRLRVDRPDR